MYKILLGSIIAVLASSPVFGAPSLTCDASGIGATTPNARMKASWTQNTYNLEWYGDDNSSTPLTVQNSAQSCVYGNALVLPSTNPSKVGYTFLGWEMEQLGLASAFLQNVSIQENFEGSYGCMDLSGRGECDTIRDHDIVVATYGLMPGQWVVPFSYGVVKGEAICNTRSGAGVDIAEIDTASVGNTCWCHAISFTAANGIQYEFSTPAWVYWTEWFWNTNGNNCQDNCSKYCAVGVATDKSFRSGIYIAASPVEEMLSGPSSFNYGSLCDSSVQNLLASNIQTNSSKSSCLDLLGVGSCISSLQGNPSDYGITEPGQWGVQFSYGNVVGESLCSSTNGTQATAGTPDTNSSGRYCWCRAMGYKLSGSNMCAVSSPSWVFNADGGSAASCAMDCASSCAYYVRSFSDFRAALFEYSSSGSGSGSACLIPSTDVSNNGNAYAAKPLYGGSDHTYGGATATTYGITQPGEWGVTWSNGDKVVGEALCSQTSGTYYTTGTPDETGSGDTKYCWCKATHYTANNAQQCSLSSPAWVLALGYGSAALCAGGCANDCAGNVQINSSLRPALFGSNVAQ